MPRKKKPKPDAQQDAAARLAELCHQLNLTAMREQMPEFLAWAEKDGPSYSDFLLRMLRFELDTRASRRLTRNLKRSGLPPVVEGLDTFDFSARPKLEARVVKELLNCRWVPQSRNIIFVGRPGLGKTRLVDALGDAACRMGYTVLKVITAQMLEELHASLADGTFNRVLRRYEKPDVLALDEFGYAPFDSEATQYLFRLVSARHRRRATMLAANTGFKSWKRFFPSEAQAVATVDRLVDQATILRFTGKSFRQPKDVHGAETD